MKKGGRSKVRVTEGMQARVQGGEQKRACRRPRKTTCQAAEGLVNQCPRASGPEVGPGQAAIKARVCKDQGKVTLIGNISNQCFSH